MNKRSLTQKQKGVIDCMMLGDTMNQAIMKNYDCKSINSAYQISFKLKKNELFNQEKDKQEKMKNDIIKGEGKRLIDIIESKFSKEEHADTLIEIIRSGDIRAKLQALQELSKLKGIYPKEANTLVLKLENARKTILSEGEYIEMQEENKLLSPEVTEEDIIIEE